MNTDPPYGISLDSEWRDRAGINKAPATESYMKRRIDGHGETTISGDTRADWSEAFALVPSLEVAYVWHASQYTDVVLQGLKRLGFTSWQSIIWVKKVPSFTHNQYWYQHEPCWYVRKKNAPWIGTSGGNNTTCWEAISPKQIMSGATGEEKFDHPTQKPVALMEKAIANHLRGGSVYEPFGGSGTTLIACEKTGNRCLCLELEPKYVDLIVARWEKFTGKQATLEDGETSDSVRASRAAA